MTIQDPTPGQNPEITASAQLIPPTIKPKNIDPNNKTFDQILEELPKTVSSTSLAASGTATKQQVLEVIDYILTLKNLPINETNRNHIEIAICELAQSGATSPKFADGKLNNHGNIPIKAGELKKACRDKNYTIAKLHVLYKKKLLK
jgi:hypothetical protein